MKRKPFLLQKGMLLGEGGWWYVLVEAIWQDGKLHLHCICDNANNIYSHEPEHIDTFLSPQEIGNANWGWPDDFGEEHNEYRTRSIPYDVVAEVLLGRHDDRFTHWGRPKETQ